MRLNLAVDQHAKAGDAFHVGWIRFLIPCLEIGKLNIHNEL